MMEQVPLHVFTYEDPNIHVLGRTRVFKKRCFVRYNCRSIA